MEMKSGHKYVSAAVSCCILFVLSANLWSKPVEIWVNSFTDQKYYQNMIKVYQKKSG